MAPANRFEPAFVEADWSDLDGAPDAEARAERNVPTEFLPDRSVSVIARNDSPDLPFSKSLNPYRGCEHGCAYCYARPTHEYLGFNAGIDFESRIMVKHDAPRLLEEALASPRWTPEALMMSGVTDCYQPVERKLEITRRCLEVLARYRNPVGVVTKNALVARDADLLENMAAWDGASVTLTLTTMDADLSRRMEPRAATPRRRLDTVARLAEAGVRVGVMVAPVVPGLNDEAIPAILEAAAEAGAGHASYALLRLPLSVRPVFLDWLERAAPGKKDRVLERLRDLRGGGLNDARFGSRFRGDGAWAETHRNLFELGMRRSGLASPRAFELATDHFRPPGGRQMELF